MKTQGETERRIYRSLAVFFLGSAAAFGADVAGSAANLHMDTVSFHLAERTGDSYYQGIRQERMDHDKEVIRDYGIGSTALFAFSVSLFAVAGRKPQNEA